MDKSYRTLETVLKALLANNQLLGWNVAPKKSGIVLVQIRINMEDDISDEQNLQLDSLDHMPKHSSYRKTSQNQTQRNYMRATSFKQNSCKRLRQDSPEIKRSEDNCVSETVLPLDLSLPVVQNTPVSSLPCFDENPTTHDLSTPVVFEECMTEQRLCSPKHRTEEIKIKLPKSPKQAKPPKHHKLSSVPANPSMKTIDHSSVDKSKTKKSTKTTDQSSVDKSKTRKYNIYDPEDRRLMEAHYGLEGKCYTGWCNVGNIPTSCLCGDLICGIKVRDPCDYCAHHRRLCQKCL